MVNILLAQFVLFPTVDTPTDSTSSDYEPLPQRLRKTPRWLFFSVSKTDIEAVLQRPVLTDRFMAKRSIALSVLYQKTCAAASPEVATTCTLGVLGWRVIEYGLCSSLRCLACGL